MDAQTEAALRAQGNLPDATLYGLLAGALFGEERSALPRPDRVRRAEEWVDRFLESQRDAICRDPRVAEVLAEEHDGIADAAIIVDVLTSLAGMPKSVPVATLALIVARRGLRRLCS